MQVAYDVQTKLTTQNDVIEYHNKLTNILSQILDNPQITLKDIK